MVVKSIFGTLCVATLFLAAVEPVHALSLRYKFKTTSAGADIYACNAGILLQDTTAVICYRENADGTRTTVSQQESCSSTATNCDSRVKCVSPGPDRSRNAKVSATVAAAPDGSGTVPTGQKKAEWANGSTAVTLIDESKYNAFDYSISNLLFDLNNMVYNAQYFVDICYRAPMPVDSNGSHFIFSANVGEADFEVLGETVGGDNDRSGLSMLPSTASDRYSVRAGIKVQAFLACDRLRSSPPYEPGTGAQFTVGPDGMRPIGSSNYTWASASTNLQGVSQDLANGIMVWMYSYSKLDSLHSCRMRYIFTETNATSKSPTTRDVKKRGGEFCTYTDFSWPTP